MSVWLWSVIIALLLAVVILAVGSQYFYNVAVSRSPKEYLVDNHPDLQQILQEEGEAVFDRSNSPESIWLQEQNLEEIRMISYDDLKLHAHWLKSSVGSIRTAILAHGYSGEGTLMAVFAHYYAEVLGWNVLMPDARGHGRSEGNYIGFGWHERLDCLGWIQWVTECIGSGAEIVLHGLSMGGATVSMASGEPLPPQVKAIVADCPYTSAKDELRLQLKRIYKLPAFPFLYSTSLMTKLRAGYLFGEASALNQVKKACVPMLFIHGEVDAFVPTWMGKMLYEACPQPKQLLLVPGADHGTSRTTYPEAYDAAVTSFLDRWLPGTAASSTTELIPEAVSTI